MQRARRIASLPRRLNTKTATAYVAPHSKASLTDARRAPLQGVELTSDGIVRMRPNEGLAFERSDQRIEASQLVAIAGEVMLSERSLLDGTRLAGVLPSAALLVENVGPYIDVPAPKDWLIVHIPGWETTTAKKLLDQLDGTPILHFGDLDPNGVRIVAHLREAFPRIQWVVPDFWLEWIPDHGQKQTWPDNLDLSGTPPLVRRLRDCALWLEQETITLDPRLPEELQRAANGPVRQRA